jgi:hypothetical protein
MLNTASEVLECGGAMPFRRGSAFWKRDGEKLERLGRYTIAGGRAGTADKRMGATQIRIVTRKALRMGLGVIDDNVVFLLHQC